MEKNDMLIIILLAILIIMLYFDKYYENFGELDPNIQMADNLNINIGNSVASSQYYDPMKVPTEQNPNYNNLNNIPKLVLDPPNSGYFQNRIRIENNNDSELMKLYEKNKNDIYNKIKNCDIQNQNPQMGMESNGVMGFNGFPYNGTDVDVYSNVTGIGKNLLTPYVSFPIGMGDPVYQNS